MRDGTISKCLKGRDLVRLNKAEGETWALARITNYSRASVVLEHGDYRDVTLRYLNVADRFVAGLLVAFDSQSENYVAYIKGDQSLYDREYPVAVLTYAPTNLPAMPKVADTFPARIMLSGRVHESALIISDEAETVDEDVIHDLHQFSNLISRQVRELSNRG